MVAGNQDQAVWAIVVAAGRGERFGGDRPKQFVSWGGQSLLQHTLRALWAAGHWQGLVVAVPPGQERRRQLLPAELQNESRVQLVAGGRRRRDSVQAALQVLPDDDGLVLVHDGVRPRPSAELVERVLAGAREHGACVPVVTPRDTVKRLEENGRVGGTLDRRRLGLAQTPQGFRLEILHRAYRQAGEQDFTDDAALVEASGHPVAWVEGEVDNIKITERGDLQRLLAAPPRVGIGYDVHRLVPGRRLVLGGVEISHSRGALAHSDGDVALHALMDAILGAAGLGDIGRHFPDDDPGLAGISSLELLRRTRGLVEGAGFTVTSVDVTIVAQRPRLAGYLVEMAGRVATVLGLAPGQVGFKATSEEGLGVTGTGEAVAAQAVAVLTGWEQTGD
ncbi:MAG: hypothetical protein DRI34_05455 [Deltaproteobacteria bacterium]|nr:MAG: hypothetical protein DRI34_05455 [Deltaproteobacteria bacterium]